MSKTIPIGTRVKVKPEYRCKEPNRELIGVVISQEPCHPDHGGFIDHSIRFEDGTVEPFGPHELEVIDSRA